MSETGTKTPVVDDGTEPIPAILRPFVTDAEIKTALCYMDAKSQCAENAELDFTTVFRESWEAMVADEADDAGNDDPDHISVTMMCEWFRQGLTFLNPALVPPGDPS